MNKYGLVGKNLQYSYSKIIHEYLIEYYEIEATYDLIQTDDLDLVNLNKYNGLNITTPYKNEILTKIKTKSDAVSAINACNTIDKSKNGYNTDVDGFLELIKELEIDLSIKRRIVILGNSRSAQMLKYVFSGHDVVICSRTQHPGMITYDQEDLLYGDIIINTTLLGMDKYSNISPVDESVMEKFEYAIDLNYNPMRNRFLLDATLNYKRNVNGLKMLIAQAVRAFEIWNSLVVSDEVIKNLYIEVVKLTSDGVVFVGMPLCGKSQLFAEFIEAGLDAIDLDQEFEKEYKMSISDYFIKHSEAEFRIAEKKLLSHFVEKKTRFIFTGGGTLTNISLVQKLANYDICFIDVPLETLIDRFRKSKNTRPILKSEEDLKMLFEKRRDTYKLVANRRVTHVEIDDYKWT